MSNFSLRLFKTILLGSACLALSMPAPATLAQPAPVAASATAMPPLAAFFDEARIKGIWLSPDARSLAILSPGPKRLRLAVLDLASITAKVVAEFDDTDIKQVQWLNNQTLVFDTYDLHTAKGEQQYANGIFIVDRDGANLDQLASVGDALEHTARNKRLLPSNLHLLAQPGAQDSSSLYVRRSSKIRAQSDTSAEVEHFDLLHLDTRSRRFQTVPAPAQNIRFWTLDQRGKPRLATGVNGNILTHYYLDPGTGHWRVLAQYDAYANNPAAFKPLTFDPDGVLYVRSSKGGDKTALYAFDLAAGKMAEQPLLALADYDFNGGVITDQKRLLGVHFHSDATAIEWLNADMKALQAEIDGILPATVNLPTQASLADSPFIVIRAYSDRQPMSYWLFNRETKLLQKIGDERPAIDARQMAKLELKHYQARDGVRIPTWLTLPKGKPARQLPLILLVDSEPGARAAYWRWDSRSQFLASRGYAVLQPEYRGGGGMGEKYRRAGWKQWGLAMQDDLADGARWAIAQGIADPQRICIVGAGNYGGYAALMGLIKDGDLFRCGVSWGGVTDLPRMYTRHWSVGYENEMWKEEKDNTYAERIGDPVRDARQLENTSPIYLADKLRQPLLLAYGGAADRVPLYQGTQLHAKLKAGNSQVEWLVYTHESDDWELTGTRIDFWQRVEKFLLQHNAPL